MHLNSSLDVRMTLMMTHESFPKLEPQAGGVFVVVF